MGKHKGDDGDIVVNPSGSATLSDAALGDQLGDTASSSSTSDAVSPASVGEDFDKQYNESQQRGGNR
jgi:hypothetical protein